MMCSMQVVIAIQAVINKNIFCILISTITHTHISNKGYNILTCQQMYFLFPFTKNRDLFFELTFPRVLFIDLNSTLGFLPQFLLCFLSHGQHMPHNIISSSHLRYFPIHSLHEMLTQFSIVFHTETHFSTHKLPFMEFGSCRIQHTTSYNAFS